MGTSIKSHMVSLFRALCCVLVPVLVVSRLAYTLGVQHGQSMVKQQDKTRVHRKMRVDTVADVFKSLSYVGPDTVQIDAPGVKEKDSSHTGKDRKIGRRQGEKHTEANTKSDEKLHNASYIAVPGQAEVDRCHMWRVLPHSKIRQACKGPFGKESQSATERRFALLIRGESFRSLGGMYDRHIDVKDDTFACQAEASKSHIDMIIAPFEACGYKVDVFLKTYKANDRKWRRNSSQELLDMYGDRVADSTFDPHAVYEQVGLVKGFPPQALRFLEGLHMVSNYTNKHNVAYDALLIIRFDLIFKKPLGDLDYTKVMFAFREWELLAGDYVADTIHYFPWKYANCAILEGFREHFSGGIRDRIGPSNLGFFTRELHDSNSMADPNPIYRMCRPEQKYDIHGGYAVLVFGYLAPTPQQIEAVGLGMRTALTKQADPKSLAPCDVVAHTWLRDSGSKKHVEELVELRFGQHPAGKRFDVLLDKSASERYFVSLIRVIGMMEKTPPVQDRNNWAKVKTGRPFNFDRLVFLRNDYVIKSKEILIYPCTTAREVCVGVADVEHRELPVLIVSGHDAAINFAKSAQKNMPLTTSEMSENTVLDFLEKAFQLPVRVFCRGC